MFTKIHRQLSRIPPRAYAIFAELLLIIAGTALVIFDLTYTPDPLYTVRFGDFYIYLALGGLIAVWSVFGLLATSRRWRKGVKIYLYTLTGLSGIQICFGIIHIILLFTLYRKHLVSACMGRSADKYFWSSLGYINDEEDKQLMDECILRWSTFAVQRTLVWAVFSAILVFSNTLIYRYHLSLSLTYHQEIEASGWPDQEGKPIVTVMRSSESSTPGKSRNSTPPPEYWEINRDDDVNYEQRERLYSEISRRRDHRMHSQYQLPSASSSADASVHPLDRTEHSEEDQEDVYVPPSPPPARESRSSDPMPSSSEKMDYDLFRSRQHRLSVHHDDETIGTMSRRRNKPQWFQDEHETLLEDDDVDDHHAR